MMRTVMAWHFLAGDKLRGGSRAPDDWENLRWEGPVEICRSGLHASERLIDALGYAPGLTLCRVCCAEIHTEQSDKLVCRQRVILWRVPDDVMRRVIVWFAYWCADRAAAAGYAYASAAYADSAAAARAAAYAAAAAGYAAYATSTADAERQAQNIELIRLVELARSAP